MEDTHAKKRVTDAPETIAVSYYDNEDILEAVREAATTYPAPIALVLNTGQVMVLADGGKGGIALQGKEGELNEAQAETFAIVQDVLNKHYGIGQKAPTKAKAKKAKSEPVSEPEVEVAPTGDTTHEHALNGEIEGNGETTE